MERHLDFSKISSALEFGCGTGLLTTQVAREVGTLHALDVSDQMLDQLAEKKESMSLTHVSLERCDVFDSQAKGPFDLIYSSMTLHHIPDVPALFRYLFPLVSPGGMVAFADLDREDGLFHEKPQGVVHHGFHRDSLMNWLLAAGFHHAQASTAHTITKPVDGAADKTYPVFLAWAKKN
jgi:2-polyprenyl-3-methyl-5-hydroxy-6-metoxy-1,4-benzoquinol methylase